MSDVQKFSVNLSSNDLAALDRIARAQGPSVTKTDALRSAIATMNFLEDQVASGARILIAKPNNQQAQELVLPRRVAQTV